MTLDGNYALSCITHMFFGGLGLLGATDSAMPIRRGQLDAANSASGQFGAGPTRRDGDKFSVALCLRRSRPPAHPRGTPDGPSNALEVDRRDGLKKVQKGRDLFHEQLVAEHAPPKKLRRYRLCDERIQRIVQNCANYGIMDYMRGLAHNFEMN